MSLKTTITDAVKAAMRARETGRLAALRLLTAAIKQVEVDESISLDGDDGRVVAVIRKMIKQRRDAIELYQKGGRTDLVEAETREIDVLSAFLPSALSEAALTALVDAAIQETGATAAKDIRVVLARVKETGGESVDNATAAALIKARLS